MDFLKKNYEKILLAVVLLGLTVAVGFLLIYIPEKQHKLTTLREGLLNPKFVSLQAMDMKPEDDALQRAQSAAKLDFTTKHNLFGPALWQVLPNGSLRKIEDANQIGGGALQIVAIKPLYLTVAYSNATASGFMFAIDRQITTNRSQKNNTVVPVEGNGSVLILKKLTGTADKPEAFDLVLMATKEAFTVTPDKPFQRVDGYVVDLKYPPDPSIQIPPGLRQGSQFRLEGGDTYSVLEIKQNDVVVLSKANNQKFTISSSSTTAPQ